MLAGRIVRLVDDHIVEGAARELQMCARGGEVHVAGHVVARRDQDAGQTVLGAAPLMRWDEVRIAVGGRTGQERSGLTVLI